MDRCGWRREGSSVHTSRKQCLRVWSSFILRNCSRFDLQMNILTFSNMLLISRMSCDVLSLSIRLAAICLDFLIFYALLSRSYTIIRRNEKFCSCSRNISLKISSRCLLQLLLRSKQQLIITTDHVDRTGLLPPDSRYPTGLHPLGIAVFFFLWWSWEAVWTVQRRPAKRMPPRF
jgi:hypothetical protein